MKDKGFILNNRFDFRDKETFKKDIYFSTMLEKYWWEKWLSVTESRRDILVKNPKSNGCDNTGEFIEKGMTAGADYMADLTYRGQTVNQCPIEIKWVPTKGKITLKENDIKAYIKEAACILFVYCCDGDEDLRKPKDYDLDKHIALIENQFHNIRWGLLSHEKLKSLYDKYKTEQKIKPIKYMGYKNGLVLPQADFDNWFVQEKWQ